MAPGWINIPSRRLNIGHLFWKPTRDGLLRDARPVPGAAAGVSAKTPPRPLDLCTRPRAHARRSARKRIVSLAPILALSWCLSPGSEWVGTPFGTACRGSDGRPSVADPLG